MTDAATHAVPTLAGPFELSRTHTSYQWRAGRNRHLSSAQPPCGHDNLSSECVARALGCHEIRISGCVVALKPISLGRSSQDIRWCDDEHVKLENVR